MATNAQLIQLSGSTNGQPIAITSTSGSGQVIHTATGTANTVDVLELYTSNEHSADVTLTLQINGTTDYTNTVKTTLKSLGNPGEDGPIPLGQFVLDNSLVMRAICDVASKAKVWGNVRRITNA